MPGEHSLLCLSLTELTTATQCSTWLIVSSPRVTHLIVAWNGHGSIPEAEPALRSTRWIRLTFCGHCGTTTPVEQLNSADDWWNRCVINTIFCSSCCWRSRFSCRLPCTSQGHFGLQSNMASRISPSKVYCRLLTPLTSLSWISTGVDCVIANKRLKKQGRIFQHIIKEINGYMQVIQCESLVDRPTLIS